MTSMPRRSQASSIALLIGLCALRMALKPGRLEHLDAALLRARDRRGSQQPVVVVDAGAAQVHRLAVDAQAVLRVELQRPDPEAACAPRRATRVAVGHGRLQPCTGRARPRSTAPASATYSRSRATSLAPGSSVTGAEPLATTAPPASRISRGDPDGAGRARLVLDRRRDRDDRALGIDVGRRDPHAVERDVHQLGDDQSSCRGRSPPRCTSGESWCARACTWMVFGFAVAQVRVGLDVEVRVAVRALRRELAVDGDHRVAVHALELERDALVAVLLRHVERLRVLEQPAREVAGARPFAAVRGARAGRGPRRREASPSVGASDRPAMRPNPVSPGPAVQPALNDSRITRAPLGAPSHPGWGRLSVVRVGVFVARGLRSRALDRKLAPAPSVLGGPVRTPFEACSPAVRCFSGAVSGVTKTWQGGQEG